ncbi:DUF4345 family protein [Aurantivibrio infirmus]
MKITNVVIGSKIMEIIITNLPRIFLIIGAGLFFYFGILGLVDPVATVLPMEISINSGISKTEIRATYGGLMLGIACFLLYAAFFEVKTGLVAMVLIVGTIGIVRLCSIFYDDSGSSIQWYLLGMELISTVIALVLLVVYYWVGSGNNV